MFCLKDRNKHASFQILFCLIYRRSQWRTKMVWFQFSRVFVTKFHVYANASVNDVFAKEICTECSTRWRWSELCIQLNDTKCKQRIRKLKQIKTFHWNMNSFYKPLLLSLLLMSLTTFFLWFLFFLNVTEILQFLSLFLCVCVCIYLSPSECFFFSVSSFLLKQNDEQSREEKTIFVFLRVSFIF